MTAQDIVTTIIAASGGSAVVVAGLGAWLGSVWSKKIELATQHAYDQQIKKFETTLEIAQAQQVRNSDARFELYKEVWINLMDLMSAGNRLWVSASKENLENYISFLDKARQASNRGRLILKEEHYQQLQNLFKSFEEYQIGKRQLLNLRFPGAIEELYCDFNESDIAEQIQQNAQSKDAYEKLTENILSEFRNQLGLIGIN
jgi:hypothetical protein